MARLASSVQKLIAPHANGCDFVVEYQEREGMGDYATNIALVRGKNEGKNPVDLAQEIASALAHAPQVASATAVAPGFVNITLKDDVLLASVLTPEAWKDQGKVSIEYVSANPTGPMHIGNVRGAPIGDVLARALSVTGWHVTREYFHNDAGAQVEKFASSLWHWYSILCERKSDIEDVQYSGPYIEAIVEAAKAEYGQELFERENGKTLLLQFAFALLEKENFATLDAMGVQFDVITRESDMVANQTGTVLNELRERGVIKEHDNAEWFSPGGEFLGDREAVVMKGDGTLLYFANDIAYHKAKFAANDVVIDIFGEGHFGHIPKLRAIADVYGFPQDKFRIIVHGQVTLKREGEILTMSKRKGNFVTAREVLDAVGKDAFRFFLLSYRPASGMQFDLALALEQSKENPVYYVQYAHARATSILQKGGGADALGAEHLPLLADTYSRALLRRIASWDDVLDETAQDAEVQRLPQYALQLAREFMYFYENVRVLEGSPEEQIARKALVGVVKNQLEKTLAMLGVSAPEVM